MQLHLIRRKFGLEQLQWGIGQGTVGAWNDWIGYMQASKMVYRFLFKKKNFYMYVPVCRA